MTAIEEAKSIISACLLIPVEKIDDNATIGSLAELDSLNFELIVLEIEKRVGHVVDPMKLMEMQSLHDLAALLEQR